MRLPAIVLLTTGLLLGADRANPGSSKGEAKLWAAITINRPVFTEGRFRREPTDVAIGGEVNQPLTITFVLVNDGDTTYRPEIRSSQLLVNGEELKDWPFIISNGIRDARFEALPSENYLYFTYSLGKYFDKPGIYKVVWKGKDFQSPEIVFRVLPKKKNE